MIEFTLSQVAEMLGGSVENGAEQHVNHLCKIECGDAGGLSFLANPKYIAYIYETKATAVVVANDFVPTHPISCQLIRVENPYESFSKLLAIYDQFQKSKKGVAKTAVIGLNSSCGEDCYLGEYAVLGDRVKIGNRVKIYPHVVIGDDVEIGDDTVIYANVTLYAQTQVGRFVTIHSGTVIGADGFGFAPHDDTYSKVPQIGNVIIEDHVEIGANTCIDRATLGSTHIQKGVKLDNLIQIAHNVVVGENTVMASQTGISGSTKIGTNCMFGGQVGIAGHLTIANEVKLAAQTGVPSNILTPGAILFGSPALDAADYRRCFIHFKNFDKIVRRLNELERRFPNA